jgi:hypothetical protein
MQKRHRYVFLLIWTTIAVYVVGGCSRHEGFPQVLDERWVSKPDSLDEGLGRRWFLPEQDRSSWQSREVHNIRIPAGPPSASGSRWYATSLSVQDTSKPLSIVFGDVEDELEAWLDGKKLGGATGHGDPCAIDLPSDLGYGEKQLVVRLSNHGMMGELCGPVTIVPSGQVLEVLRTKFAYISARPSEDWVKDALIYEIYLRSFSSSGTFRALENRLPELKDLGVTVLCLLPIHPVGELNRRGTLGSPFAVQDYYAVNPEYGTLDDFKSLVNSEIGRAHV